MRVITQHKHIYSLDRTHPVGAKQDNHSNPVYIEQICALFNNEPFSYMDLGCAGGQSVLDIAAKGYTAIGIEGCGRDQILRCAVNPEVSHNWREFFNKYLFEADIGRPFEVVDDDGKRLQFDLITAWDFLEHPPCEDIPQVITNIKTHLKPDGLIVGLIAQSEGPHHRCVKPNEWWVDIFLQHGLKFYPFPLTSTPRAPEYIYNKEEFLVSFRPC
jgi:SAM-dependent methyltransferase